MPSVNVSQVQSTKPTRCPHIIQLGDDFKEILDKKLLEFEHTQQEALTNQHLFENEVSKSEADEECNSLVCSNQIVSNSQNFLKCNECKCFKNLWLCLKENCYYVGCGQDQMSNKHSSAHAAKSFHPLSINLTTKNVWCELCSTRVNLDSNIPSLGSNFKQLNQLKFSKNYVVNDKIDKDSKKIIADDYDLISYLDKENDQSSIVNDENDSQNQIVQYGQLGLDNLGNTCYMNAALQALSNCYAFTSFFLDCTTYIHQVANLNKSTLLNQSSNRSSLLSLNYVKLMKDLWQPPDRLNIKTNKIEPISSLTPVDFVHSVKLLNPMFRGYQQNDSQEFLIYLMDQLHEELKRPILIEQISNESTDDDDDEDDDETVIQSSDKDSGFSSTNGSCRKSFSNDLDTESIDSYVTCGDEDQTSDLSDNNLDFSDADDGNSLNQQYLNNNNNKNKKIKNSKSSNPKIRQKPNYTSIITETFEGKLMSQVQCLECNNISTTTESFLHLSIPIPSKEYLQMLQNRVVNQEQSNQSSGWLGWLFDIMKGYVWSNTIRLSDCLTAFFSDDDLKGDNMYSCEKCKKLTNGVKYSKILNLPEVLIIHLKRFRHDAMFSTGKISAYITFPIDNLNMQPFVHKECKNEITQYDLNSVICHYGGSEGGHYTSYARNYFNEEWYEFDDSFCRQVESLTVQNAQAYVLFYKKKNIKTDGINDQLRNLFASRVENKLIESMLRPYFISKQWMHKLKYFGESGPIDNSDFLCKHNFVYPRCWKLIEELTISCTEETWQFLVDNFGIKFERNTDSFKNFSNYLFPCKQCQLDDESIKQRQLYEKEEFLRLQDKWNQEQYSSPSSSSRVYAISKSWFKEWEKFVQMNDCPFEHQIPGEINNLPICMPQKQKENKVKQIKHFQINPKISNFRLSEEMWKFLLKIYGGGPELLIAGGQQKCTNGIKDKSVNGKIQII
ncbi:unnamed protein product [Brachionus calyciflorus]|uniref:Ubiquitin carboxyl-terminal hydrolase n=1 Tax=Brachionus calyciflorus TaxID=104777 RepID=A0A813W5W9_9BILA|nr:unnamed protein product [Brachionus calyciflorus]